MSEILTGTPDFNWESYENGENISGLSHEQLEQAYGSTLNKVSSREVVNGTVIGINKREVIVDINYKQDAIIPISEFRYNPDLKVGKSLLGAFLFGGDAIEKKVKVLSGGEKARLSLAKMLLFPTNLLILDEPTNHLDMLSKDILKSALIQFDGTLIIVSHDRDFLQGLTNKVYEFRKPHIKEYIGDIYDFLEEKKLKELDDLNKKQKSQPVESKVSQGKIDYELKKQNDRETKRIEREIKKLEEQIESLENEIAEMDKIMSSPSDFPDVNIDNAWYDSYGKKKDQLQNLMNQWEDKQMELEM